MNKILVKMNILLALLTLTLGLSDGVNAAAYYGVPLHCTGAGPGINEAYVYTGQNYTGTCYSLRLDGSGDLWTSWDVSTGFPNDQIQSVWVGNVTLVLFWNSLGTRDNGVPLYFPPGRFSADLNTLGRGNWDRQASAARVQTFGFGQCGNDPNTLSLFTGAFFNQGGVNDCTELAPRNYPTPVDMGFRNDTAFGAKNNTGFTFGLWINSNYNSYGRTLCPFVWDPTFAGDGVSQANANNFFDELSSITFYTDAHAC